MLSNKDRDNVKDQTWPRKKKKMQMQWLWGGKGERPVAISLRRSDARKSPAKPPGLDGRKNARVMKGPVRQIE